MRLKGSKKKYSRYHFFTVAKVPDTRVSFFIPGICAESLNFDIANTATVCRSSFPIILSIFINMRYLKGVYCVELLNMTVFF
jgi:hypothetical protein